MRARSKGNWLAAFCAAFCVLTAFAAGAWAESPDYGNSISTATSVTLNSSKAGAIGYAGDWDYFRISVPSSGTLTVYTTGSTDTYGYLKNSSGTDLASNDDSSDANFRISRTVTAGTYYVAVRHYNSSRTGSYIFNNQFSGSTAMDDHGNSISTATAINFNTGVSGVINNAGDVDYFRVQVPSSGTLTAYTTGSTDTYGILKNSSGTDLASNDDYNGNANFRVSASVPAGTDYIAVRHYNSTGTGAYAVYATFTATAQSTPTLLYPVNGSANVSAVTFQWNSSPGATNYRIIISQNSNFSGFNESSMTCDGTCSTATTTGTQYARSSFNLSGHTYYWRVRANNSTTNSASGWSAAWSFTTAGISYGYPYKNGPYSYSQSHSDPKAQYAYDFGMPLGTEVVASAGGTVASIKQDSTKYCPDTSCANDGNYVVVNHADGTSTLYLHLQANSVPVSVGQSVAKGQVVGKVGLSGYTYGPHLHFQRQQVCSSWWCQSMPVTLQ
ncbi:peptidoglycan DD-metalloendopeptidase family protein [Candidatus Electronema sp. JM]|uniref:peptidoglycan DD-metalloendopeptidase family protein n=1 Tax=Candidatus Electronema sp. JM TaxID=3401571 RepID=UPI003AA8F9C7